MDQDLSVGVRSSGIGDDAPSSMGVPSDSFQPRAAERCREVNLNDIAGSIVDLNFNLTVVLREMSGRGELPDGLVRLLSLVRRNLMVDPEAGAAPWCWDSIELCPLVYPYIRNSLGFPEAAKEEKKDTKDDDDNADDDNDDLSERVSSSSASFLSADSFEDGQSEEQSEDGGMTDYAGFADRPYRYCKRKPESSGFINWVPGNAEPAISKFYHRQNNGDVKFHLHAYLKATSLGEDTV